MGKSDFLTPKAIANRIKSKGLQKLRWYCQMCEKQCRDENGFKCHTSSEPHMRQMMLFAENTDKYLSTYSQQFHTDFTTLLSRRYGTRRVKANDVYQEFISDRNHLHMNATTWPSLSAYVAYLGKEGICEVDETERGFYIRWIDRSPETLARQEAVLRKERAEKTEDERERKALAEQISKARTEAELAEKEYTNLERGDTTQPIKLQFKGITSLKQPIKKPEFKKLNALASASKRLSPVLPPPAPAGSSSSSSSLPTASTSTDAHSQKNMSALDRVLMKNNMQQQFARDRKRGGDGSVSNMDTSKRMRASLH